MSGGSSGIQKIVNPAFKLPPPKNPTPLQQPEYFKRESKSLEDIHLVYELSSEAKRKSNHWLMKAGILNHFSARLNENSNGNDKCFL